MSLGADNSGAWYHFFGTQLARLTYPGVFGDIIINTIRYTWGAQGPLGLLGFPSDEEDDKIDVLVVKVMDYLLRGKKIDSSSCSYAKIFNVPSS